MLDHEISVDLGPPVATVLSACDGSSDFSRRPFLAKVIQSSEAGSRLLLLADQREKTW